MLSLPIPAPLFYKGLLPFNAGQFMLSPIHVKNVADIFLNSVHMQETIGKTYNLGGRESFSWSEIIDLVAQASKKSKLKVPAPIFIVRFVAFLLDRYKWFPITRDQLSMLIEGNEVKENYFDFFNIEEIRFELNNLSYLN
jgi:NADH dehydrogenase